LGRWCLGPVLVLLPSRVRYWTVLDGSHRLVQEADDFLVHHRLGRDGAESTYRPAGELSETRRYRVRSRHRLSEPDSPIVNSIRSRRLFCVVEPVS
jgi:hypothetical protein